MKTKDVLYFGFLFFLLILSLVIFLIEAKNENEKCAQIWRKSWAEPLLKAGLQKNQIDNCMKWAFGEDYLTSDIRDSAKRWNERHSDRFIMKGKPNLKNVAIEYLANIENK